MVKLCTWADLGRNRDKTGNFSPLDKYTTNVAAVQINLCFLPPVHIHQLLVLKTKDQHFGQLYNWCNNNNPISVYVGKSLSLSVSLSLSLCLSLCFCFSLSLYLSLSLSSFYLRLSLSVSLSLSQFCFFVLDRLMKMAETCQNVANKALLFN